MNDIIPKLNTYLKTLEILHKKSIYPKTDYNKGFWKTKNNYQLARLETSFIKKANIEKIISHFYRVKSINDKEMLFHLSGWSKEYKKSGKFLYNIISMNNARLNNAAARAIFPLIVTGKVQFKKKIFIKLLKNKNRYCKNKALGIMAFLPKNKIKKLSWSELAYIKKMTRHKEIMISEPAKMIIEENSQ